MVHLYYILSFLFISLFFGDNHEQGTTQLINIATGWSQTSVNATIFRKNSVVSHNGYQYAAFYDGNTNVTLAKRKHGSIDWQVHTTQYQGNVQDAHNVICIMVDRDGYLHMAWDHHGHAIRYCKSVNPESLEMGNKASMLNELENNVTYPEFYKLSTGDLIFVYRDGSSGNGNLIMNRYNTKEKKWYRVQSNLIDGESERNAYWQLAIDKNDIIHLSWVWRESGDVATNHDLCYGKSLDLGKTWVTSNGLKYNLPINLKTAEIIHHVPQKSNLINQTSMTTDNNGNPYIATYFRGPGEDFTQFKIIYQRDNSWIVRTSTERQSDFDLSGGGTRSIPISRPQILHQTKGKSEFLHMIYRDEEFQNRACLASVQISETMNWKTRTLTDFSVERWEPSFDTELWKSDNRLNIYVQKVGQGQGETTVVMPDQMISILEVDMD